MGVATSKCYYYTGLHGITQRYILNVILVDAHVYSGLSSEQLAL